MFRTLLILLAAAVTAVAGNPPDAPARHRLMKELKLTDAQQEQFEKISYDTQKKQIELRAKTETARLDLRRLMDAETIDRAAVEKKFTEIAGLQTAMKMNHLNAWSEKNKALTPDQQKLWKKALKRTMDMRPAPGRTMKMRMHGRGMREPVRIEREVIKREER